MEQNISEQIGTEAVKSIELITTSYDTGAAEDSSIIVSTSSASASIEWKDYSVRNEGLMLDDIPHENMRALRDFLNYAYPT